MKITKVGVSVLRVPSSPPYTAGGRDGGRQWHVLARVTTSDGVEGVGYIVYPRPDLMTRSRRRRASWARATGMSVLDRRPRGSG